MVGQGRRKMFSVERAMLTQQMKAEGALSDAGSAGRDCENSLLHEMVSLRGEIAEIKALLSDKKYAAASHSDQLDSVSEGAADRELRIELAGMIRSIAKAKTELAAIKHPDAETDRILAASNELDAIVIATENATNKILGATEIIEKELAHMAAIVHEDQDIVLIVDKIANQVTGVLEACNFQDITGQRITKVVKTMQFLEERILAMIDIWGFESFIDVPVPEAMMQTDSGELLNGPQLEGDAISQADIDALFD